VPRSIVICTAIMFAIAAVCLVPLTETVQNDLVKRLYMCKLISIDPLPYTLTNYEDYFVCLVGREPEGIHPYVAVARKSCGQEDDGYLFLQV
jgi:hypothetical protein